jgi:hypothetical protein
MTMQYDVLAAHAEATGTLVSGRNRLKGYQCLSGGTAGDVIIRDGGASGTIRLQFNISTNLVAFGYETAKLCVCVTRSGAHCASF